MINKKPFKLNQKGFSLIEVLVASAILGIVALGAAYQYADLKKFSVFTKNEQGRDQANQVIAAIMTSPAAIFWSSVQANNTALANCVHGDRGPNTCQNETVFPLRVYIPNLPIQASGDLNNLDQPTTAATPYIFFNSQTGQPCPGVAAPTITCQIAAAASFKAFCARRGYNDEVQPSCAQAESIEVTYRIWNEYNISGPAGDEMRNSSQTAKRGALRRVIIPTSAIALYKPQDFDVAAVVKLSCPPGETAVGVNGQGNVICQKIDWVCPQGTVTVGLDRFGRPIYQDGMGKFADVAGVAQIICASLTCGTSLMTSMTSGALGAIRPECFASNYSCPNTTLVSNATPPQTVVDVFLNGVQCADLPNSCYEINNGGADAAAANFVNAYSVYNGNISAGIIQATCEPWRCLSYDYMMNFTPAGNCYTGAAVPYVPPPGPPAPTTTTTSTTLFTGTCTPWMGPRLEWSSTQPFLFIVKTADWEQCAQECISRGTPYCTRHKKSRDCYGNTVKDPGSPRNIGDCDHCRVSDCTTAIAGYVPPPPPPPPPPPVPPPAGPGTCSCQQTDYSFRPLAPPAADYNACIAADNGAQQCYWYLSDGTGPYPPESFKPFWFFDPGPFF
ncbi:MAG: prepilin-type N-terminal cleavage/methylation domain-containing protein [Bdellovibrionota bacterium]